MKTESLVPRDGNVGILDAQDGDYLFVHALSIAT
jgi:hypothetical protein